MSRHQSLGGLPGLAGRVLALLALAAALALAASNAPAQQPLETVAPGQWRIDIHEVAVVAGDVVLLSEIAEPLGDYPPERWAELSGLPLWEAPPVGRPMTITGVRLTAALNHYLGQTVDICLVPDSVTLQRGGTLVMRDQLAGLAMRAMTPRLATWAARGAEAELRDFEVPEHVFLSDSANTLEVELPDDMEPGRVSFTYVETAMNGEALRRVSGSAYLDVWAQVPAAARPLNRGDALRPQDVTFVRKNLAFVREDIWDGQGGPWRLRTSVGENQPIHFSDLEGLPVVQRGDTVLLVFEGAHIRLTVPAEALADGGTGETIAVRNLESDREVLARVRDSQTVVVF